MPYGFKSRETASKLKRMVSGGGGAAPFQTSSDDNQPIFFRNQTFKEIPPFGIIFSTGAVVSDDELYMIGMPHGDVPSQSKGKNWFFNNYEPVLQLEFSSSFRFGENYFVGNVKGNVSRGDIVGVNHTDHFYLVPEAEISEPPSPLFEIVGPAESAELGAGPEDQLFLVKEASADSGGKSAVFKLDGIVSTIPGMGGDWAPSFAMGRKMHLNGSGILVAEAASTRIYHMNSQELSTEHPVFACEDEFGAWWVVVEDCPEASDA